MMHKQKKRTKNYECPKQTGGKLSGYTILRETCHQSSKTHKKEKIEKGVP